LTLSGRLFGHEGSQPCDPFGRRVVRRRIAAVMAQSRSVRHSAGRSGWTAAITLMPLWARASAAVECVQDVPWKRLFRGWARRTQIVALPASHVHEAWFPRLGPQGPKAG